MPCHAAAVFAMSVAAFSRRHAFCCCRHELIRCLLCAIYDMSYYIPSAPCYDETIIIMNITTLHHTYTNKIHNNTIVAAFRRRRCCCCCFAAIAFAAALPLSIIFATLMPAIHADVFASAAAAPVSSPLRAAVAAMLPYAMLLMLPPAMPLLRHC